MKARAMNPRTVAAAMMLMAAAMASPSAAQADKMASSWMGRSAEMRTVMHYTEGAWLVPTAVILKNKQDWKDWNAEMVAMGKAVGAEPMPNVDWAREAVLVVTMGESYRPVSLDLKNGRRVGLRTEVELQVNWNEGGSAPCQVIAMDKRLARNVRLLNAEAIGLSPQVPTYSSRANTAQPNSGAPAVVADLSWGYLKDAYRE